MRCFISLVNDNHVDNNMMEILVYVYLGLIVNTRQNKDLFKFEDKYDKELSVPIFRLYTVFAIHSSLHIPVLSDVTVS